MYALVDANSYYCSAEQVFRPEWRGKPVIVLSNNDGCVVAANRQAKEVGIEKFKPYFQVKPLCEQHGVIALSSNYELYADLSSKMMQVIGRYAPEQKIYSIDEIFLSFERCSKAIPNFEQHGIMIRKAVWKECRLPVCVGFGRTLTLSKLANHAAKRIPSFQGVCVIDSEQVRTEILSNTRVGDVWGIGSKTEKKLSFMGISTALQLANYPAALIRKEFNVDVERVVRELNGQKCKSWELGRADKKQIFSTRSVGKRITDVESLKQALSQHAHIASRKARKQKSLCRVMMCFCSSSPFDGQYITRRAVHRFCFPTSDVTEIARVASELAEQLYLEGVSFYKVGIGMLELTDGRYEQPDLFNQNPNDPTLMEVFDALNHRYGTNTLFLGSQGIDRRFEMRRELLTPQYTTCWKDLPKIRC
ncbi:TPA: Y-family DNA polymerase [Vibrio parahaemolyticus]|uniref:Y-family DNA polymerase n=1 Tax=Vibrio harveyi group TaxID=717610 RepID=UPI00081A3E85|nr:MULTISPECIES: Y-family DNA polymerase [Vibrio harveyi group]ANZ13254.1 error-prone repair protein UmuC [Vibrio parahaemolyticus]MBE3967842.1 Y-family DNA polymerase [Vibrio parahaemolyticus]MBO0200029.1 Y-family DNA polymerase [Vibrio alginolyticus]MDF4587484.1 Y-family DNA polymerase [Vibrio parahaemolyticus]MDF4971408.1 Y-family DNA polymerase [Vibrio parahaemolyticus]